MFQYKLEEVQQEKILTKIVNRFEREDITRFLKLQQYYDVKTEILRRPMEPNKPNNKLAHGFARYISNMATGYFLGKPIKYILDDVEYSEALQQVLKKNYINNLNFEVSKESSKKGIAFMLLFVDEEGMLRIKKCNADEVIPIYSQKLGEFLECSIRIWSLYDVNQKFVKQYAELYTKTDIITYVRTDKGKEFVLQDAQTHFFEDIPIITIWNNEDQCGDYENHITLIDAYDRAQSDTANDMEYFSDAYLCIAGANEMLEEGATEDGEEQNKKAANLRKNKILFLDEKGQAEWLVKNINDTAQENYKNRIYKDIFFLSQVPALSDESFSGNLTGVAIKYKLIGLEELAIMKQNKFEASQKKLIKMITFHLNLKMNKEFDPEKLEQKYERNFINNVTEMIENTGKLEGIVSRKTQLEQLPNEIVPNADEEIRQMEQEQLDQEELPKVELTDMGSNL